METVSFSVYKKPASRPCKLMFIFKETERFSKETLTLYAKELYQGAFDANQYFLLMQQYKQHRQNHLAEIRLSPAFYGVVYEALQKSCFMEIAKLFDRSSDVISIGFLLKACQENISLFPEYRNHFTITDDGKEYSFPIPYQHQLKPEEELFFKDQVESQRIIFKALHVSSPETSPVTIDLTFQEFLELYRNRFHSLKKKQSNVQVQRNKIYAHNDQQRVENIDSVLKKNPITYPDIQELIDFALDCSGLILGILTGEVNARQYANINDWDNTLWFAQLGLKYQEYDLKQKLDGIEPMNPERANI